MIGQLHGILKEKKPPEILLEVQGVCYEIQVPMTTLFRLPEAGQKVQLHTHLQQREDAQLLFGFINRQDKAMFRALIRVSGVGPRMALAILSGMDGAGVAEAVRNNDLEALVNMPGIGKKTAERLIVDLRDRLEGWETAAAAPASTGEAVNALLALGYKPQQAAKAVEQARRDAPQATEVETLIRMALKSLG